MRRRALELTGPAFGDLAGLGLAGLAGLGLADRAHDLHLGENHGFRLGDGRNLDSGDSEGNGPRGAEKRHRNEKQSGKVENEKGAHIVFLSSA